MMTAKMTRAVLFLLSTVLCISGQHTCDTEEEEVKQYCTCDSSFMKCTSLNKLPNLMSLPEVKQLLIEDSHLQNLRQEDFTSYDNVEALTLKSCEIRSISDDAFKYAMRLKGLRLPNNYLTDITSNMFLGRDLEWLDLFGNQIESLPEDLLKQMSKLERLDLSYNKGLQLSENFLEGSSIKNLSLNHIGLPNIPSEMLAYGESLAQVGLNGNAISSIPAHAFMDLHEMDTLSLEANNISVIDDAAFVGLQKLQFLNLANNRISELKPEVMKPIEDTVRFIMLNNNLLTTLHTDVIKRGMNNSVRLGHNPWVCDCKIKWMKDLDLRNHDPENVTCARPENFKGHPISNVTEEMLCSWCEGCDKSKLAYAIGIPILIISAILLVYYIYRLIQSRRQNARLRKDYRYSNVYKDTVEPVRPSYPQGQRA